MVFIKKHQSAIITVAVALILWEGLVWIFQPSRWILPPPTMIVEALINDRNVILSNAWVTLYEAILGFGVAIVLSVILAFFIDYFSAIKKGIYPILVASQTIPIFAIAPLLFIWFGFGILPKVMIVALIDFFPIVINLTDGLNSADKGLIKLLKSMNASKWQIFKKVKFPSALPYFFSGLRIAATYSVMGAVIGEWIIASEGLGLYIKNTFNSFLTDQVFAGIIVIVLISIMLDSFIVFLESKIIPWNKSEETS